MKSKYENDCSTEQLDNEIVNVITYAEIVMKNIAQQRLHQEYCDLHIIIEDEIFPVHRCVMAASCDFFVALNRSGMMDSQKSDLVLKDINVSAFKTFLNYVYSGELQINEENIADLLRTVTHLQCSHALELCQKFMKNSLSNTNCVDMLMLSELYSMSDVVSKTLNYIERNFYFLYENSSFLRLPFERIRYLLKSDSLRIAPEINVFLTVKKWLEHDSDNRMQYAAQLVEHVRLLTIPVELFVDVVSKSDFMRNHPICIELLIEAFEYFSLPLRKYSCTKKQSKIRNIPVMVCVNENMYIFNNEKRKWHLFGSSLSSWKTLSQKFIVVNNFLYACGGYSERNRETTGGCHRFDPQTGIWTNIAAMVEKRQFFTLTANNDMIVAVGGVYGDRGNFYASHPVHSPLEVYPINQNVWKPVKCQMPVLKWPGACVFDDFVFIVGGKYTEGHNHRISQGSFLVNMKLEEVSCRKSPITPRFNSSMFYMNGKAVLFGGEDDKYRLAPCVELYDFENDEWTEIAQIPVNLSYQYISTSYMSDDSKIHYLMEEHDGPTSESYVLKVAYFDLVTRSFSTATTLPHPQAILASRWCSLVFPQDFFTKSMFTETVNSCLSFLTDNDSGSDADENSDDRTSRRIQTYGMYSECSSDY